MTATIPATQALHDLRDLDTTPHHVVSCYVRLGPAERMRDAYQVEVRHALAAAREALDAEVLSHDDRTTALNELARVLDLVQDRDLLPGTPGMAVFACEPLGLLDVVPLPRVHRTRVVVGHRPALAELVAAEEAFGRVLAAAVDRGHVRLFDVTAFDVTELLGLHPDTTRGGKYHSDRHGAPGWGERDFHDRIGEERHRRFALVTEALRAHVAERPVQGLVLAGPQKEVAALRRFLPAPLARLVLGTARLNPTSATAAEVRAVTLALHADAERRRVGRLVDSLREQVGEGWAVVGVAPVLRALARGEVKTLILRPDARVTGFRCTHSDRLAVTPAECDGEGAALPVADLAEAALDEALRQRLDVVTVDEPAGAAAVDGMAALLRFR